MANWVEVFKLGLPAPAGELPVMPVLAETSPDGAKNPWWLPVYEQKLTAIAELCVVLSRRLKAIIDARSNVDTFHFDLEYLVTLVDNSPLVGIRRQVATLLRLLYGLFHELDHPRDQLVDNLALVLKHHHAIWRQPVPLAAKSLWCEIRVRDVRAEGNE
jgi:hypothetical protein